MKEITTKIRVEGKEYKLMFGRPAAEEFTARMFAFNKISGVGFNIALVIVYSGLLDRAIYDDIDFPIWNETYELMDAFHKEDDSLEQYEEIYRVFSNSYWGAEAVESVKKLGIEIENKIVNGEA